MKENQTKRPLAFWLLLFLLFFQGVSATPAGLMLVIDPTGESMHQPATCTIAARSATNGRARAMRHQGPPAASCRAGTVRGDLTPVWKQNGPTLVSGNRWGQVWGAAAIEG